MKSDGLALCFGGRPRAPGIREARRIRDAIAKGISMAKKRDRKGNRPKAKQAATADGRGLRRHLRVLEELLAEASKKESRRVRKLEKAHIRRQRIEAELEHARPASSGTPAATAQSTPAKSVPAKSRPAKSRPAKSRPTRRVARPSPKTAPTTTTADPSASAEPAT